MDTMDNLHDWVASIEAAAATLYRRAAGYFAAESGFAAFLLRLAEEEEWHHRLLAAGHLENGAWPVLPDPETMRRIEVLFAATTAQLDAGTLTRAGMYEALAAAEFSEWNDFFLYCLGSLRGDSAEFRTAVAEIGRHKAQIVDYLGALPDGSRYLEVLRNLPEFEAKRILLVEGRPGLALLLRGALGALGEVEVAESGRDGLALMERQRYDVVLSDIDMTPMDSLDFYQQAVSLDPALAGRIVFFADQRHETPQEEHVSLGAVVAAPALLGQIRRAVALVASGARQLH